MKLNGSQILAEALESFEQNGQMMFAKYKGQYPDDVEFADLIQISHLLRQAPKVQPSLAFRLRAKERLVSKLGPRPDLKPTISPRRSLGQSLHLTFAPIRLAFSFAVFLVIFGLGTVGLLQGVSKSVPGDSLYRLKLGVEQVSLLMRQPETAKIEQHLELADQRLVDVQVSLVNGPNDQNVREAVQNYAWHLAAAQSLITFLSPADQPGFSATLHERLTEQQWIWARVRAMAPAGLQNVLQTAVIVAQENISQVEVGLAAAASGSSEQALLCLDFATQKLETATTFINNGQPELAVGPLTTYETRLADVISLITLADLSDTERVDLATLLNESLSKHQTDLQQLEDTNNVTVMNLLHQAEGIAQSGQDIASEIQNQTGRPNHIPPSAVDPTGATSPGNSSNAPGQEDTTPTDPGNSSGSGNGNGNVEGGNGNAANNANNSNNSNSGGNGNNQDNGNNGNGGNAGGNGNGNGGGNQP